MKKIGFITNKIARIFDEINGRERTQNRNDKEINRLKRKISKLQKANERHEQTIMERYSQYDELKYKAKGEKCLITIETLESKWFEFKKVK